MASPAKIQPEVAQLSPLMDVQASSSTLVSASASSPMSLPKSIENEANQEDIQVVHFGLVWQRHKKSPLRNRPIVCCWNDVEKYTC